MATDAEVIEAVLHGDVDRYAELVIPYQQAAWRLAYGFVGNWDDAKELSQNGFVKAYRHLRAFRKQAKFSTWLYRIIANECKDFFKRNNRRPRLVSQPEGVETDDPVVFEVADPGGDPSDILAARELAGCIQQAIGQLAGKQRTAFVLHHLNGLPIDEVAGVMGCRVGTVKSHLFRSCERLRVALSPYLQAQERVEVRE